MAVSMQLPRRTVLAVGDDRGRRWPAGKGLCIPACGSSVPAVPVANTVAAGAEATSVAPVSCWSRAMPPTWSRCSWLWSRKLMSSSLKPSARMLAAIDLGALLGPAVDQHVAVAAGDEDRANPAGADEIGVGVDPHRRRGPVPVVAVLAGRRPARARLLDRRARTLDLARRLAERDADLLQRRAPRRRALTNIACSVDVDHRAGRRGGRVDRQPADRLGDLARRRRRGRAGCRRAICAPPREPR